MAVVCWDAGGAWDALTGLLVKSSRQVKKGLLLRFRVLKQTEARVSARTHQPIKSPLGGLCSPTMSTFKMSHTHVWL